MARRWLTPASRFFLGLDKFHCLKYHACMDFRYPDKPTHSTPEAIARLKADEYICQGKYDGWRCQIYRDNGWHVLTRMGESLVTHARAKCSPAIVEAVKKLEIPEGSVLDGEFVGPRGTHRPCIYLFDCLKWAGEWLGRKAYEERWEMCQKLAMPADTIQLAVTYQGEILAAFNKLKQEWLQSDKGKDFLFEGVVAKWRRGRLMLDRNASKESNSQFKCRFREIGEQRY